MSNVAKNPTVDSPDSQKTLFGFWIYIMTDCILFATLFATWGILRGNNFGGATSQELFDLPPILTETLILLLSSYTCGLAMLAAHKRDKAAVMGWLMFTFVLGGAFLAMEITEFRHLVSEGNDWQRSGFLSGFFTLVATHGLHITSGLIWMAVLIYKVSKKGIVAVNLRRLTMLSMFWHFLDIVWIFIFTMVYLLGAVEL
jgi:cytochrome o ubiquinol oxidase subunit 3